jgi:hypothetical protein
MLPTPQAELSGEMALAIMLRRPSLDLNLSLARPAILPTVNHTMPETSVRLKLAGVAHPTDFIDSFHRNGQDRL